MRISVAFWLLFSGFCLLPTVALAEGVTLGVVRSGDNATQWTGITNRLNQSGVAYCVVDLQSVQKATDLTGTTVLFLPNVESLSPQQAIALSEWMKKGGRLIASGPAGNLSVPEVRQMLRGVLGAYWAFPLSEPSALKPSKTGNQQKDSESSLRGTVHGGVVIPTTLTSQTAATWSVKDSPPAVINTNRTTFFG
ncbi:MAG TPA: glycoside hydrolase family 10 protein, partial [Phormidium sp.]